MSINESGASQYSSIGETCHQCCHKISGFAASCKNRRNSKPCSIKLCQKCLLDRYGEKADQVAAFQGWLCPKCRGICNCTVCMEKKGHQLTGILTNTKKATGFSTDIEMLKRFKYLNKDVVLPKKREKGISIDGKVDSCDSELGNVENNNKRNLSEASIDGDENKSKNPRMNRNTKDKGNVGCVSAGVAKNDKGKEKVSAFLVSQVTAEDVSEALQFLEFRSTLEKKAARGIEHGWGDGDGSSSSSPLIKYDKDAMDPEGPHDLPVDAWKKWLAYWSLLEVIAKSEMARQNQYNEKSGPNTGCSRHSGGSRSALEHSLDLQKESGGAPNAYQCFLRTHKRNDGTFVDERSRLIAAGVEERVAAARQVSGDAPIDMTKLYLEVVGGVDKQHIYGLGSEADVLIGLSSSQSNLVAMKNHDQDELTRFVLQFAMCTARQSDRLDAKKRAQMQAERQEMQDRVARMLGELYIRGLFPPPHLQEKPPRRPNA